MTDEVSGADVSLEEREGLTLERYAEVMAHVRHFPRADRAELFARLDLTGQRWESAIFAWTEALAEESAREEEALSILFGTTFARTRARLKKEQPTLPSLGVLPEEKAVVTAPALVAVEVAPPMLSEPVNQQVGLPSYMLAAPTPPPLTAVAALPSPMHQPARISPASPPDLRATVEASDFPRPSAMPFQAGGTPEQGLADVIARMTAAQGPLHAKSGGHLGETVGLAPSAPGRALPFSADPSGALTPSWMPAGILKFGSVDGTQLSTDPQPGPALPFEPAQSSQLALENALTQAVRLQGSAPVPTKGSSLSGTMGPGSALDLRKPELPFSSPSAPIAAHVPALSVERYASLCVELSATPANAAQTLRRYQLAEREWPALDAEWKARFSREPETRAAWEKACAAYRAWLAQVDTTKR